MKSRAMYDPGEMRERVEIFRDLETLAEDSSLKREFLPFSSAWCAVNELTSNQAEEAGALESTGTVVFITRYRTDLKESDVVVWLGRQHTDLKFRMLGNRERLEITATRRGPHNGDQNDG